MRKLLERPRLSARQQHDLAAWLRLGPWAWPDPALAQDAHAHARSLVPEGPPPAAAGTALALTVEPASACAWVIGGDFAGAPALGPTAQRAWATAIAALPRSLPVLWRSLRNHSSEPRARLLATVSVRDGLQGSSVLDGESFGLAFVLLLASRVTRIPLRTDVVATGRIAASGAIDGVEGLALKLAVVRECLPGIRKVLVPQANVPEATATLEGFGIDVVGVSTCHAAVQAALASDPLTTLLDSSLRDEDKQAVARSLFELSLRGRAELADWQAVGQAAQRVADWFSDTSDERRMVAFAGCVARRHAGLPVTTLPDMARLALGRPRPLRLKLLAHELQAWSDNGLGDPDDLIARAREVRAPACDAHREHHEVEGALGWLLLLQGRPDEALELLRSSVEGFLTLLEPAECSYSLARWAWAAGVLRSGEQLAAASAARSAVDAAGGLDEVGRMYYDHAHARALVLLGGEHACRARDPLERLLDVVRFDEVACSSLRWLARIANDQGRLEDAERLRGVLRGRVAGRRDLLVFDALAALDMALESEARAEIDAALAKVVEAEPRPASTLLAQSRGGNPARWLADTYPY